MNDILASQGQRWLAKVPQAAIAQKLTSLCFITTVYLAAVLTWQAIPQGAEISTWRPTVVKPSAATATASIEGLNKLSLFGAFEPSAEEDVTYDAPKTTLRLLLTGLVASLNDEGGLAIIENRGKQETYGIGDNIQGTRATLFEVHSDRAILAHQGRYETLMLDGVEYSPQVHTKNKRGNAANKGSAAAGEEITNLSELRAEVLKDPAKVQDYLSIAPVMNNETGELKGYRLNPSKNKALFTEVGLLPNDLAIEMNGYDLTNLESSMQALSAFPELTEISLTVERNGQLTELQFALPTE